MEWIECKVSIEAMTDAGEVRKEHRRYLVNAVSFAEAEERIYKGLSNCSGLRSVESVRPVKYVEMFLNNGRRFYKAKVGFIQLNEKSGWEKKTYTHMLVQANDFADALDELTRQMKSTLADWEIASITETALVDVFPYEH